MMKIANPAQHRNGKTYTVNFIVSVRMDSENINIISCLGILKIAVLVV